MPSERTPPVELLQGTLDLIILRALSTMGPLHAYALAARLEQVAQHPFTLNQAQALSFRGREAEPGTHEHRRLGTVARRLHRRGYGSRAPLTRPRDDSAGLD